MAREARLFPWGAAAPRTLAMDAQGLRKVMKFVTIGRKPMSRVACFNDDNADFEVCLCHKPYFDHFFNILIYRVFKLLQFGRKLLL